MLSNIWLMVLMIVCSGVGGGAIAMYGQHAGLSPFIWLPLCVLWGIMIAVIFNIIDLRNQ